MDCPKCHKKAEKGHKCTTPKVLQVNQAPEIVTFHTVELQSEAAFPIANGAYRNTVVSYIEDSSVYLYNSDGIPVKLSPEAIREFNQLAGRPKYGGQEMTSATDIPDLTGDVQSLSSSLSSEEEARILADQGLAGDIAAEALARGNADTAINNTVDSINTAINKTVVTDLAVDPNPSTTVVNLDNTKTNIKTGTSTISALPLPVASSTQAGVMNSATYDAISQNSSDINALINGAVAIAGLAASPTQSDLTTAWEAETGLSTLMNRAGIYDIDNDKVWTYYVNTDTWYPATNTTTVTINTFTNSSEGTIKGSTNVGQVFAESDGTGSVNGWDTLSGQVSTNTSAIASKADASAVPTKLSDLENDIQITTSGIADSAVTNAKIDWASTVGPIHTIPYSDLVSAGLGAWTFGEVTWRQIGALVFFRVSLYGPSQGAALPVARFTNETLVTAALLQLPPMLPGNARRGLNAKGAPGVDTPLVGLQIKLDQTSGDLRIHNWTNSDKDISAIEDSFYFPIAGA